MAGFDAVKFQKREAKDLLNFNYKIKKGTGYLSKNKNDIPKKSVKFGNWVYPDERLELKQTDYIKIKKPEKIVNFHKQNVTLEHPKYVAKKFDIPTFRHFLDNQRVCQYLHFYSCSPT